jgi:peptidoglycan/xylan/chitin deacetylase (PgdA/CDA1 family)
MYHRIGDTALDRRFSVTPQEFQKQMRYLRDREYRVIGLAALLELLAGKEQPPGKVTAITFDDGFEDTIEHACPILKDFHYPATFFIVSSLMGLTNTWMQGGGYPVARLIGWEQARRLDADGFSIGSHTATHPILPEIDEDAAACEIRGSKCCIENRLGIPVHFFAYPYGRFDQRIRNLVQEFGYQAACSTQAGFNGNQVDRFALRRLDIYGTDSLSTFGRNLLFGENQMNLRRLAKYYVRRGAAHFANQ